MCAGIPVPQHSEWPGHPMDHVRDADRARALEPAPRLPASQTMHGWDSNVSPILSGGADGLIEDGQSESACTPRTASPALSAGSAEGILRRRRREQARPRGLWCCSLDLHRQTGEDRL